MALAIGIASQAGLALAPVVRSRGPWLRAAATTLMIPAFILGVASYRDVLGRPAVDLATIAQPMVLLLLSLPPVYGAVAVWMWRAPAVVASLVAPTTSQPRKGR